MADGFQQKRLAVDSNILFDLAEGQPFAEDFRKTFLAKGYSLETPPTVVLELTNFFKKGDAREQELARIALTSMLTKWKISPISLSSVQRAYTQNFKSTGTAKVAAAKGTSSSRSARAQREQDGSDVRRS